MKIDKSELARFYPFFFTIIFIVVILQYSFFGLESIFYDFKVRNDFGAGTSKEVVLITLDEESDQFLGENYPYSYATHSRFIKKLIADRPAVINYLVNFQEPFTEAEDSELKDFKQSILEYSPEKNKFRFGTNMDAWGEQLPPESLRDLGYSLAILNVDNSIFARDDVNRRAILYVSGEESLHLWAANQVRSLDNLPRYTNQDIKGSYYLREADASFSLYRYFSDPTRLAGSDQSAGRPQAEGSVTKIPFHRVLVGFFPRGFFENKIVIVGRSYVSNSTDYIRTPYNKNQLSASKLSVHAQIIQALYTNKTVKELPQWLSHVLSIFLGLFLSLIISRFQPARGLLITISVFLGIFILSYSLFTLFGYWLMITHMVLTVFIVYYIWVPFRAIGEYKTRYKMQEETKLLKKVDDLKQNFISLMSHDLKTPVAKISNITDLLMNKFDNTLDQYRHLKTILESTRELNNFINSILDLTKVESKNLEIKKISKDINSVIDEVVKDLNFEAKSKKIEIHSDLSPLYPVQIDPHLMKRVFSNLIENAIKYSGQSKTVQVKTWDDDRFVYVEVRDDGPGIPEGAIDHIFEKFYRVKNDASHSIKGTGLGLYLVKYFVELHDGEISATSEVNKGTSFIVKLKNQ